jgi:hypothetical protein
MAADNVMALEQATDQVGPGSAEMAVLYQSNLAALLASSRILIGSCQTMQGVVLAFLQSRAKEALAAGQRLAECGSPQSALEIQLDFAREALQAYADQFHTLGRITSAALEDCSRPLKRAAHAAVRRGGASIAA